MNPRVGQDAQHILEKVEERKIKEDENQELRRQNLKHLMRYDLTRKVTREVIDNIEMMNKRKLMPPLFNSESERTDFYRYTQNEQERAQK